MLRFLVDTCAISDIANPRGSTRLKNWARGLDFTECALSVLTVGELRRGVEMQPSGRRRDDLWDWLEHGVMQLFYGRVIAVDEEIARAWGVLSARARVEQRRLPEVDGLLLATAEVNHLTVVTRNVRDFEGYGVPILNPWEPRPLE